MHYHLEIVMPPCADVDAAVQSILAPFDENYQSASQAPFWDWWQIGGRYSNDKVLSTISHERLDVFKTDLGKRGFTVHAVQFGKQELSPASQAAEVDALWRAAFPESALEQCPLFAHSGKLNASDVWPLANVSSALCADRCIIAVKNQEGHYEAQYMLSTEVWNGLNYQTTGWDGNVLDAINENNKHAEMWKPEYRIGKIPQPDWLVVTVDYHS